MYGTRVRVIVSRMPPVDGPFKPADPLSLSSSALPDTPLDHMIRLPDNWPTYRRQPELLGGFPALNAPALTHHPPKIAIHFPCGSNATPCGTDLLMAPRSSLSCILWSYLSISPCCPNRSRRRKAKGIGACSTNSQSGV